MPIRTDRSRPHNFFANFQLFLVRLELRDCTMQGKHSIACLWGAAMTDTRDVELYDPIALREVAVMANLMIVANTSEDHLTQEAIDIALGLDPAFPPLP